MRTVVVAALASAFGASLPAQMPPGEARGSVTSATSKAPIVAAEVLLIAHDTVRLTTNERGEWLAPPLPEGSYRILVRALGFRAAHGGVDIRASAIAVRNMTLTPLALALDAVVVTAARREQKLKDVIVATELIGRDAIERSGASNLSHVLVEHTGIELFGGHPAGAGVMIQGIGSERVLVLLDGQPIAGRIGGEFDASRIPTSVIERVEIVKGPQAALYGSDAMGGVVNVITRTIEREGLHLSGGLTAGSQARFDGALGAAFAKGAVGMRLDLGRRFIEVTPGRSDTDGALAARHDIAAKIEWAGSEATSVEGSVLVLDERQRWASGSIYNFADNQQWNGKLRMRRGRLTTRIYGSVFDHLSRASSQRLPIAGDSGQRQVQRLFQGEALYNSRFGRRDAHALDVGLQLRRDDTRSVRIPGGLRTLTTLEPLAQLEFAATPGLGLTGGLRVSRSSQWGTHVTPSLALRYHAGDAVTLRASTGTGFRAPDFRELYMFFVNQSVGYSVRGNPDLRPEHSRNVSLGAELTRDAAFGRMQLYWNEFRDFIETRPITRPRESTIYLYENVDDGRTRGIELEGGSTVAALRVEAGYSLLDTRQHATGKPLLGRPAHASRISTSHALPMGVRFTANAVFTARTPMQRDSIGAITSWRDAFLRMDVRASRTVAGIELLLGADNVFDRQPSQWAGLTRRHVYTAISWNSKVPR